MIEELNRCDYECLTSLHNHGCFSYFVSMTVVELSRDTGISRNTIYKRLQRLCEQGYLITGCMAAKAPTYYLSDAGKNLVETHMAVRKKEERRREHEKRRE